MRAAFADALAETATVDEGFGPLTVDVPADRWVEALALARDELGCTFFDWLTAVDELADGFRVVATSPRTGATASSTCVCAPWCRAEDAACSPRSTGVFAGRPWHERETYEMFGIDFTEDGLLALVPLLLPEEFEGHPLRKEFVLAARVAKAWPGAKEPGESDGTAGPRTGRRRARPPGAPEPEQWGRASPAGGAGPAGGGADRAGRAPRARPRPSHPPRPTRQPRTRHRTVPPLRSDRTLDA